MLVIGAGPAGCAAGITAARAGARVLVVDRAQFPRAKTCGDAVSNRGAQLVDALVGQPDALRSIPHAIVEAAAAVLPDGTRVSRSFADEPGFIVPRFGLDDLLRRALERSGASLMQGVQVRALELDGGRVVGATSDRGRWRARVTITADGPGSLVWSALGRRYRRGRHLAVATTGYYAGVEFGDARGVSEHYFEPELPAGYAWAFPPVAGLANVGVYQRVDQFERGGHKLAHLLDRFLAHHPERFAKATREGALRTWSLPLAVSLDPPAGPGVLAAGDAGSFVDPLAGEGIWQALFTGRLAAEHAAFTLARPGEEAANIRAYQRACERAIIWPSMARLGIQEAMRALVASGAYRHPLVQRALAWGYGGHSLEITKRTT